MYIIYMNRIKHLAKNNYSGDEAKLPCLKKSKIICVISVCVLGSDNEAQTFI